MNIDFDHSKSEFSKAAGGGKDVPQLEGVKINYHWAIVYSKDRALPYADLSCPCGA
jgi:hypothetical protein